MVLNEEQQLKSSNGTIGAARQRTAEGVWRTHSDRRLMKTRAERCKRWVIR